MRVTLRHAYTLFFFVGVFFIPFNAEIVAPFLGEFRRDSAVVFFLFSFFLFFIDAIYKRKIRLPQSNLFVQILILFVGFLIVATLVNGFSVYDNYMKQTSGISRFVRQFFSLSISLFLFLIAYNLVSNYTLKRGFLVFRKVFFYSFVLVIIYGCLEIVVVYFNISIFKNVLLLFDYFPFTEVKLDFQFKRISSVSYEPPFLAIYLITVAGWMFSYILTSKGIKKYAPTLFVFLLTFFSGSRTALIVVLFQFLIFMSAVFTVSKKYRLLIQRLLLIIFTSFLLLFAFNGKKVYNAIETKIETLNFNQNLSENISNKSRFGIQYTSLLIFAENPIFGVGFGQQGYHAKNKYPTWATHKNYEFTAFYLNENVKSFPPGFNMYTRLLAETGLIGFGIFISFLFLLFSQCKKLIKSKKGVEKIIPIVLVTSFVGFAVNWLQFDSFRVYGFWICLAILIRQMQEKRSYE